GGRQPTHPSREIFWGFGPPSVSSGTGRRGENRQNFLFSRASRFGGELSPLPPPPISTRFLLSAGYDMSSTIESIPSVTARSRVADRATLDAIPRGALVSQFPRSLGR